MPTLKFNLSEAEIEKLNYERYAYPDPMVQKRIFATAVLSLQLRTITGYKIAQEIIIMESIVGL